MRIGWLEIKLNKSIKGKGENKSVKLVVTGVCQDQCLRDLEKQCKEKKIDIIATNLPVLGTFPLGDKD